MIGFAATQTHLSHRTGRSGLTDRYAGHIPQDIGHKAHLTFAQIGGLKHCERSIEQRTRHPADCPAGADDHLRQGLISRFVSRKHRSGGKNTRQHNGGASRADRQWHRGHEVTPGRRQHQSRPEKQARLHPSPPRKTAALGTPRPRAGRQREVGLLACGSFAVFRLPERKGPVA